MQREREMNGLLYVDKPVGVTSHDVVAVVRRAARVKRVGHAGTLDPFATGLLVIAVGMYTRLLPYIVGDPKVYDACIRFGTETDTDDGTGAVVSECQAPTWEAPDAEEQLNRAMRSLTGRIAQIPPSYSAKHVDGTRAHTLARAGNTVVLPPVSVTVHSWSVLRREDNLLRVRITCGGGTYVRALARDLGRAMQSAAHCADLRRVSSGPAHISRAVALNALVPGSIFDGIVPLQSPLEIMGDIAHEILTDEGLRDLAFGRAVAATQAGSRAALLRRDTAFGACTVVGIGERTPADRWQPKLVLLGSAS